MFQLTFLIPRDSIEELPKFSLKLDGVALSHQSIESSITCVQSFVWSPKFTQCDFFSDNGIVLLTPAVTAAGTIRGESSFKPWVHLLLEGYETTFDDLKKAHDAVVERRKAARDTCERWFGVRNLESTKVGERPCRIGVRKSDVVEVGEVDYLIESVSATDHLCSCATVPQ